VAKLELKFARFELYQDETSDRLKGLPAFKAEARKYITSYTEPTRQLQSGAHVGGNGNFRRVAEVALKIVKGCDCVDGCPKCVYSPYCGNNNKMLSRRNAVRILQTVLNKEGAPPPQGDPKKRKRNCLSSLLNRDVPQPHRPRIPLGRPYQAVRLSILHHMRHPASHPRHGKDRQVHIHRQA
jgi:hypothetical protein